MATPRKKRTTPKKQKNDECVLTLQLGVEAYSGAGETFLEALQSLPKPSKIMIDGILTAEQNGKRKTLRLSPVRMRRVFYTSPTLQAIHAKQFEIGLK